VSVRVASDNERASVEITDDGVGFVPDGAGANVAGGHFGITGLRALVGDAGGVMDVRSAPGDGTTVSVGVPLS
jgi:signal transduction histidine kinase